MFAQGDARLATLAVCLASAAPALGQTVTVTTTADAIDIATTGTIDDLPGPDGLVSLSEAMIATDNTPGHQTVGFAIPADQLGWCCPQFDGIAVFHSITGFYWRAFDEVTIDGATQTAFAGDTNPDGAEILLYGETFYLIADNSTLRCFHGTSVQCSGSNALVEDNTGAMNLTLFGGGGSTVRNNDCGTIKIDRSSDNVVVGNTTSRVRVLGGGSADPAMNNRIGGPDSADRNFITGYGTWNSEGLPAGAAVQLVWNQGTLIEGNRIGTTPDGLAQGNTACTMGINLQGENHDVTVRDNLIAGILGHGMPPHHAGQLFGWAIYFWGSTTNIVIEGNTIGLDANGAPTLGSVWGVNVDNFSFYTVDGVQIVGNEIAGHIFNGVRVGPTATMRLSANSIHDNGWLDIDLIPDDFQGGVSANDPLDADTGGNGVQNFPVIDDAIREGSQLHVTGSLHSSPADTFTLEFFGASACDESGFGGGEVFLGTTTVTTNAAGDASWDHVLPATVADGWVVTATATLEPVGATSEFSACVAATGDAAPGDVNGDGVIGFADVLAVVGAWGPCAGACPADVDGNGVVGFSDILMIVANWTP
ncbi:MAG: hypothetical protein ACYTGP_01915 [Planctomycetota bacterium]|jgi:hypothetical protein